MTIPSTSAADSQEAPRNRCDARAVTARLLLVDDNRDALEALKTLLEVQGHEVVAVDNGQEAVELMRSWRPEVAVVDVGMPGMDGFEVARAIRSHVELAGIMIVAFILTQRAKWSIPQFLVMMISGLIPVTIFFVEHFAAKRLRAQYPELGA